MSAQMQKSGGRSRRKPPAARTSGVAADAAIVRMAIVEAECREAERHSMIEQAAYYRAEKRGFGPGHELEDWLAAEQDVAEILRLTIMSPACVQPSRSVS
jgi:hypothetical protein